YVNLVALAHDGRLRDLAAIDVRPVGALEVGDDEATVTEKEPRMFLGNIALREHEVVALYAANVDLVLVEELSTLGPPFFADDNREHGRSNPAGAGRARRQSCPRRNTPSFDRTVNACTRRRGANTRPRW